MLTCYGKRVYSLELVSRGELATTPSEAARSSKVLVKFGDKGDKVHNVSCDSISWQSDDWDKE